MCVCVCVCVCLSLVCMVGVIFVYVDMVYWFYGCSFLCLVGYFNMIIWTPTVLSVLYACILYFCICTCSAQLNMFHIERCSRNTLIIIIIIIIMCWYFSGLQGSYRSWTTEKVTDIELFFVFLRPGICLILRQKSWRSHGILR